MSLIGKRKCRCCKESFIPDYRSVKRQRYCNKPECRKASKARCQRRWVEKNPTYFKGSDNVDRMLEWRRTHSRRQRRKGSGTVLQDICDRIDHVKQEVIPLLPLSPSESPALPPVLQDFCIEQHPVFIGLIAHITGCVLQDDIAVVTRRLEQLGQDVICSITGGRYDPQVPHLSRSHPQHSGAVQLGGSPSGP